MNLNQISIYFFRIYLFVFLSGFRLNQWPLIFVLPLIIAMFLFAWRKDTFLINQIFSRSTVLIVFSAESLGWILVMFFQYFGFHLRVWDIGSFSNSISNFVNGNGFYNSFMGVPELSDHFSPALLLFSPLFYLPHSMLLFLIVKWIAFLCSFYLISRLCREYGLSNFSASLVQFVWLVNPIVHSYMVFQLQPSTFTIPIILLSFLLYKKEHFALSIIAILSTLLFKESLVFAPLAFGLFLSFEERKLTSGIIIICFSVLWGYVVLYLMPEYFTGVKAVHESSVGLFKFIPEKILLVFKISVFFMFIPLLRWRIIPMLGASLGLSIMLGVIGKITLSYHYADIPSTFFCIGMIISLSKIDLSDYLEKSKLFLTVFTFLTVTFILNSPGSAFSHIYGKFPSSESLNKLEMVAEIKKEFGNSGKTIFAAESIAGYLYDVNKISFIDQKSDLQSQKSSVFLFDPNSKSNKVENEVKERLEKMKLSGELTLRVEFMPFLVFETADEKTIGK